MFFLKTVSILVQLKETKSSLIFGDQEYTNMPSAITDTSYDNVNWNRMLKYETSDLGKEITRSSYCKATYDIYLDTDKYELVILAKKSFDEFVSKQNKFIKEFIPNLITAINFNKDESDYLIPKDIFTKYLAQETKDDIKEINNFVVNKDFTNKNNKYKFRDLYQLSDKNVTIETKNKQFVHQVIKEDLNLDPVLANAKYIDLNNSLIYLNGYVPINNEKIYLNLVFEDKKLANELRQKLINKH